MKIFYFIPSIHNPGGMERTLFLKVNYLSDVLGHDVTIITTESEKYGQPYFELSNNVKVIPLLICFSDHFSKPLIYKILSHYKKLVHYKKIVKKLLELEKPDICISLLGKEIDFIHQLKDGSKKIGEIHFARDIRRQFIESLHKGWIWSCIGSFRTWQLERAVSKLDQLVVLTQQDLVEWKLKRQIICIPNANPICSDRFASGKDKRVISVGRLDPQKGYDRLIEAWFLVHKKHPDWTFAIYGDGYQRDEFQKRINVLGLQAVIHLERPTQLILEEYLKSAFYVMSSRYEGLPMVLIEAMACGLPCVSFDCKCGPKDVITDGVDGILVSEGHIEGLAKEIIFLIENEDKRSAMSIQAIEKSKTFDIDKIMNQWVDLFNYITK